MMSAERSRARIDSEFPELVPLYFQIGKSHPRHVRCEMNNRGLEPRQTFTMAGIMESLVIFNLSSRIIWNQDTVYISEKAKVAGDSGPSNAETRQMRNDAEVWQQ